MNNIKMLDLFSQYMNLKSEIDNNIDEVLKNTDFINGVFVKDFQLNLSKYLNVKNVISCANGTDAIQLALMSLDLQEGDEVITSDFSFIAAAEAIALLKLKPVFVDIDIKTFNIDCSKIVSNITKKTKAIIPIHLFGQSCDMENINKIAKKYNLFVIEDTAQALGSDYIFSDSKIKKVGTIADIGCTSFFPSKNLGCYGDGGAVFTDNDFLAEKIRMLANHGAKQKYYHEIIGLNSRLDTLQAAILQAKLPYLDSFIANRQKIAKTYNDKLKNCNKIIIPHKIEYSKHSYHQYTIILKGINRKKLQEFLMEKGIVTAIYYPVPLHKQKAFSSYKYDNNNFTNTNYVCNNALSLPIYPELSEDKQKYICDSILSFFYHY